MDGAGEPPHADAQANANATYPTTLSVFTFPPRPVLEARLGPSELCGGVCAGMPRPASVLPPSYA